ncbi:hypothetical protein [Nannocystis punicea]|uniref:Zinc-ribbon domain-containing protein n=1 Tax=Nannocystis punicea TaxID=2995304 RepID=A0ABY7HGW6_9BACT|nr:hypothetical protein [Nannocystis poenicansa]WAS98124.1 hypothetical protein O0S08_18450 [Nannocystis poenicansa]
MPQLIDCPACARALRREETACPFCGAEQRRIEGPRFIVFGVWLGLMTASCGEKSGPDTETTSTSTSTTTSTSTPTSTSTSTDPTTAVTEGNTTTTSTTTTSTTDGSASDSMDSFNVTTAYAAALDGESAGAPPAVTESDTDDTGEPE